jgi:hypothetical protein
MNESFLANVVDPIVVSVIQHRLLAIVAEMGEAMLRTAFADPQFEPRFLDRDL